MADWTIFSLIDKPLTGNELFIAKLREHVDAGGDTEFNNSYVMPCRYLLGRSVGNRRLGVVPMSEDEWAAVEALGIARERPTSNDVYFHHLTRFIDAGGDPDLPTTTVTHGYQLGAGLSKRRRGDVPMSEEEWARCEALGVPRVKLVGTARFLERLRRHIDAGGDPAVRTSYMMPCGYKLGSALALRRAGRYPMTEADWAAIEALGVARRRRTDNEVFLDHLREYIDVGGDAKIAVAWTNPDGYRLGAGLSKRRRNPNMMSEDEWAAVKALGVSRELPRRPTPPPQAAKRRPNEIFIAKLTEHIAAGGTTAPRVGFTMPCAYRLGSALRKRHNGTVAMSEAEWARVEALGVPRAFRTSADTFIAKLTEHIESGGDPDIAHEYVMPCSYRLGYALGNRRNGGTKLSDDDRAAVEALGVSLLLRREASSDAFLTAMREHIAAGGSPDIPSSYRMPDGYRLGAALAKRRRGQRATTTAEWAVLERLGVRRTLDTPNELFVAKVAEHIAMGGPTTVPSKYVMPCGYRLGRNLSNRRCGVVAMSDAEWAAVHTAGLDVAPTARWSVTNAPAQTSPASKRQRRRP